ncbi:RluA family pseudouridine synthase [Clostridium frigidicarnis]|uniref:Pseudouridine synthase n=1 Tax=Clostridium frigidicarnis TaxID=84698 RepID=A0A1I0WHD1_9CLOT|nr:RluA family pseudouridine synthase [Clostridium frigidicarnis]SFA88149.1 23S rRNA pseudouridine1911/1915/1917 synthase [Clostridium frigidicarnis]
MEGNNFLIEQNNVGIRIDKFLNEKIEDKSRSFIQGLIDDNQVLVNEKNVKSNYKLRLEDKVVVNIPEPKELWVEPEDIPLDILYEDSDVIVVNKPQGMVVHPAAGVYNGTLVNALLNHCKDLSGINGVIRPGIVHRIDKDTSGVLVIAKNDYAHNKLSEQFKAHSMKREYYALVEGIIKDEEGIIETNLGRHPTDRIKFAVVSNGKHAITHYKVIERFKTATLVKCNLETGRTHQIRIHMAYIGHPLIGDSVYGYKKQRFKATGQLLHAKVLGFIHPTKNEFIEFESPLPEYFQKVLTIFKNELK